MLQREKFSNLVSKCDNEKRINKFRELMLKYDIRGWLKEVQS